MTISALEGTGKGTPLRQENRKRERRFLIPLSEDFSEMAL
jgi:hypothetical protein